MTSCMCTLGYANDYQCHLRGMRYSPHNVDDRQLWLALKLKQNALFCGAPGRPTHMVRYYYRANDGGLRARAFKALGASVIPLWMNMGRRWHFMGMYRFDTPPLAEVHRVTKRKRPYVTDHSRVGVRVTPELWITPSTAGDTGGDTGGTVDTPPFASSTLDTST